MQKAFEDLIQRQRRWLFGLPPSERLNQLLSLRISPHEAQLLARIPHLPVTGSELSQELGMDEADLQGRLDALARRGLIMEIAGSKANRYALADAFFQFYRMPGYTGANDAFDREISPLLNAYYREAMAESVLKLRTRGLRAIPVRRSIRDNREIRPFEDVALIIEHAASISVSTCACRHRKNLDPNEPSCKHETETCMHLDKLSQQLVRHGIGRQITKQEALKIAEDAADAGLIHGVSNMKAGIDTICSCCACCCAFLESKAVLKEGFPGHQPSNYLVVKDEAKCTLCGLCVKRCPVSAMGPIVEGTACVGATGSGRALPEKKIVHHPEKCIGCGVCARKCPGDALALKSRTIENDIPNTPLDFVQRVLSEQKTNAVH